MTSFNGPIKSFSKKYFRDHSRKSVQLFVEKINNYFSDEHIINSNSFDETVENTVRKINDFYNNYCPVRSKAVSSDRMSKPWLTGKILKMIKFKHFLYSRYKKLNIPHYIYSNFNTRLNNIIRYAKKFHMKNQFEKNHNNI